MTEVPRFLEGWSWVAGILATLVALVTLGWQIWPASRRYWSSDWKVLDQAFEGVRVGAPVASLQKIPMRPVKRSGDGKISNSPANTVLAGGDTVAQHLT